MIKTSFYLIFLYVGLIHQAETLPGLYKYWNVVDGYDLQIKPDSTFKLTETGNAIPLSTWEGTWETKQDTLILNFIDPMNGEYQRKHIIESEYLLRGNLNAEKFLDLDVYAAPNYLYKTEGYYKSGSIKVKGEWDSYSKTLGTASKKGEWVFYSEDGTINKIIQH